MWKFTSINYIGENLACAYDKKRNRFYLVDIFENKILQTPYRKVEKVYGGALIVKGEDNKYYLINTKGEKLFSAPKIFANDGRQCIYLNEENHLMLDRPAIVKKPAKEFEHSLKFKEVLENGIICLEKEINVHFKSIENHATVTYYIDKMGKLVMGKRTTKKIREYVDKIYSYHDDYMMGTKTYSKDEAEKIIDQASGFNRKIDYSGVKLFEDRKRELIKLKSKLYAEDEKILELI